MTSSRTWLLATILMGAASVHPAQAKTPASTAGTSATAAVAHTGHHGEAFAAKKGARAIIVEPDGRVIATDGRSDLVAPASIAERRTKAAIARLIDTAAQEGPVHDKLGSS